MNTKQVEYFLELTQTLNYRQASEKLGITQPTLSKAMQHLENDLGFSLFYKQGRSIRLTISLGVAAWRADIADGNMLIKAADQALYLAKVNGRNRVEINAS